MPPFALMTYLEDSIISITENALADANFLIPYLIKNCLEHSQTVCLLSTHNGIDHYKNVFRRLGLDPSAKMESGSLQIVDFLSRLGEDLVEDEPKFLMENRETLLDGLFSEIDFNVQKMSRGNSKTCLIIDDLSHFLDLKVDFGCVMAFANRCVNLTGNGDVRVAISTHVSDEESRILARSLDYVADVTFDVRNLSTGRSHNVSGVMKVTRNSGTHLKTNEYHYKAGDKGIVTFFPGESLNFLYR